MKDSLERLIDEEESRVIMDLVNRFRSPSQEHDSSSRENLITDTVIIPVGGSEQSSRREWNPEAGFRINEGERSNSGYHAPSHSAEVIRVTNIEVSISID